MAAILFLLLATTGFGQKTEPVFSVVIDESSMSHHYIFFINNDSAKASIYSTATGHKVFKAKISAEQRTELINLLMGNNWAGIAQRQVEDNGPDDYQDFDFVIQVHNKIYHYNVYLTRVNALVLLVEKMNRIFPVEFEIAYDEKYLKHGK